MFFLFGKNVSSPINIHECPCFVKSSRPLDASVTAASRSLVESLLRHRGLRLDMLLLRVDAPLETTDEAYDTLLEPLVDLLGGGNYKAECLKIFFVDLARHVHA